MTAHSNPPVSSDNQTLSPPSGLASVADLPECCAGEGYPGIAHDLETMRAERDSLLARCASLEAALRAIVDRDFTYDSGVVIRADGLSMTVIRNARAALKGAQP